MIYILVLYKRKKTLRFFLLCSCYYLLLTLRQSYSSSDIPHHLRRRLSFTMQDRIPPGDCESTSGHYGTSQYPNHDGRKDEKFSSTFKQKIHFVELIKKSPLLIREFIFSYTLGSYLSGCSVQTPGLHRTPWLERWNQKRRSVSHTLFSRCSHSNNQSNVSLLSTAWVQSD